LHCFTAAAAGVATAWSAACELCLQLDAAGCVVAAAAAWQLTQQSHIDLLAKQLVDLPADNGRYSMGQCSMSKSVGVGIVQEAALSFDVLLLLLLLYHQACTGHRHTACTCVHTVSGSASTALPIECQMLDKHHTCTIHIDPDVQTQQQQQQ
jgi:hypothetical protein